MIDYDKLKIAHTIAAKINRGLFTCNFHSPDFLEFSFTSNDGAHYVMRDIDDAILKLTEMSKPKQKYALNSIVYALDGFNGIIEVKIHHTYITSTHTNMKIYVSTRGAKYAESELYPTREALIEAQIDYWQKLRCQDGLHAYDTDSSICLYCDTKQFSQPPKFEGKVEGFTPETVKVRGIQRAVSEFNSCTHERDENEQLRSLVNANGWFILYPCKHCEDYYLCD